MGFGDRLTEHDLVALFDQILDGDVKVGVGPQQPSRTPPSQIAPPWRRSAMVRNSASGATSSSIVLEMSSASPVLAASQNRLTAALLLVSWIVDIWLLL